MLQKLAGDVAECNEGAWQEREQADRAASRITPTLREQGLAVGPDDVARLDVAYHAALNQLGLANVEDGATLTVAKRIVDLAAQGERDPVRLTVTTVEALSK